MLVCRVDEEKLDHFNRFVVSFGVRLLPKQLHRKDKERKKERKGTKIAKAFRGTTTTSVLEVGMKVRLEWNKNPKKIERERDITRNHVVLSVDFLFPFAHAVEKVLHLVVYDFRENWVRPELG